MLNTQQHHSNYATIMTIMDQTVNTLIINTYYLYLLFMHLTATVNEGWPSR